MPDQRTISTKRSLLIASTGGHLEQLTRFVSTGLVITSEEKWITFNHAQAHSLLKNRDVSYVNYIPSRGLLKASKAFPRILNAIRTFRPDTIVSTGAAIAVPAALAALLTKRSMVYIESVSRFEGPSMTGRILAKCPWVQTYTQHANWASDRWKLGPTILGSYHMTPAVSNSINKVFISLGTISPYRFDRAVDALRQAIPKDIQVRIQYGSTARDYGNWQANSHLTTGEFSDNLAWADLVILHAGVGSALNVLESGKRPVLLVREAQHQEHVDDHQAQIAKVLTRQELCVTPDLSNLDWETLKSAALYNIHVE